MTLLFIICIESLQATVKLLGKQRQLSSLESDGGVSQQQSPADQEANKAFLMTLSNQQVCCCASLTFVVCILK